MGNFQSYSTHQDTPAGNALENTGNPSGSHSLGHRGGVYSITIQGGEAVTETAGVSSWDASKDLSPFAQDDWRSTARSPFGSPTNEIDDNTLVQIGGVSAKVGTFVQAGALVKQGDGYALAGSDDQGHDAKSEQQQEQTNSESGSMPTGVVEAINSAMDGLPDFVVQKGGTLGIAVALGDSSFEDVVAGVAQGTGMNSTEAAQRVQFVMDAYQAQADSYITGRQGIASGDLPAFYDFCRQPENKGVLQDAIQKQVYGDSMAAWKPLVDKFMSGTAPSIATLRANGFETKTGPGGEDLVRVQGTWMSTQAAAKAGFI